MPVAEGEDGTDLRTAHYAVFRYLAPEGTRVTALAEAAGMTQQSMGELVAHLERRGYVERCPDPADGRARLIVATAAGRVAVAVAAGHIRRIEDAVAAEIGAPELAGVCDALARLPGVIAGGRGRDAG
ncbi:MarR family winged helix-turn-helix transcriptional regulator [Nocardia asteroides]|uniref:MarR family winged helix-turn-helix transcriptional regulator n=1 Tax=Nocardia asteroides TaxID=1824 RepID=UPI003787A6D3